MTLKLPTLAERNDRYIRRVFRICGENVKATAKVLGMGRTTLYRYLKKKGLVDFRQRELDHHQAMRERVYRKRFESPLRTL